MISNFIIKMSFLVLHIKNAHRQTVYTYRATLTESYILTWFLDFINKGGKATELCCFLALLLWLGGLKILQIKLFFYLQSFLLAHVTHFLRFVILFSVIVILKVPEHTQFKSVNLLVINYYIRAILSSMGLYDLEPWSPEFHMIALVNLF